MGKYGAHLGPIGPRWAHIGPMNLAIWDCISKFGINQVFIKTKIEKSVFIFPTQIKSEKDKFYMRLSLFVSKYSTEQLSMLFHFILFLTFHIIEIQYKIDKLT